MEPADVIQSLEKKPSWGLKPTSTSHKYKLINQRVANGVKAHSRNSERWLVHSGRVQRELRPAARLRSRGPKVE